MSFYTFFDWFKKLSTFSYLLNLKIEVVLKAPLGLFKFISDYLPYFENINIFFNIRAKQIELIYKD
jgi:hypothetical protein